MAKEPYEIVTELSPRILADPAITEGLNTPYSPNQQGQTTTEHITKQLKMLEHLSRGDFVALHAMVDNPDAPDFLQFDSEELRGVLEPAASELSLSDWEILTLVVGYHDLGKVSQEWARDASWNLEDVDWVAHDYDSKRLLENNPDLLAGYELSASKAALIGELCKLHSLPGQYFFGEGNLVAYEGVRDSLAIARVHGLLDVMSALNHKMVKPILDSHREMGRVLDKALKDEVGLHEAHRNQALATGNGARPLGPLAWRRLALLLGKGVSPELLERALETLPSEFLDGFNEGTDGPSTWYGTYVANAFGQGLVKALENPTEDELMGTCRLLVKIGAAAASHMTGRQAWAFSSLDPSLYAAGDPERARVILTALDGVESLKAARERLNGGGILEARVAESGVEISMGACG